MFSEKDWQFHLHDCLVFVTSLKSQLCESYKSYIIVFFQLCCLFLLYDFLMFYTYIYILHIRSVRISTWLSLTASWLASVILLFSSSVSYNLMKMRHVRLLNCVLLQRDWLRSESELLSLSIDILLHCFYMCMISYEVCWQYVRVADVEADCEQFILLWLFFHYLMRLI